MAQCVEDDIEKFNGEEEDDVSIDEDEYVQD